MPWPPNNGTPYMPSNGTEGEIFQEGWCGSCTRDAEFRRQWEETGDPQVEGCAILAASLRGEQPKEWTWLNGGGHCSAFTDKPVPPERCAFTMEMFE